MRTTRPALRQLLALSQGLLGAMAGEQDSPLVTVRTTLGVAALFNPLRRREQEFDGRFYRKKYDADQALGEFAAAARSETQVETLTGKLVGMVQETMQPEQVSLWLRKELVRR